jgi:hypothetical protein
VSRPIVLERTTGIGIAASVLAAGLVVGAGAFLGGYFFGEGSAPTKPVAPEETERVYSADELQLALEACERPDVEIEGASAVISPMEGEQGGSCVLDWFDAPGPVRVAWSTAGNGYGETGSTQWSNVSVEWEQVTGGRQTTITVE